jgi:hypothetical protein
LRLKNYSLIHPNIYLKPSFPIVSLIFLHFFLGSVHICPETNISNGMNNERGGGVKAKMANFSLKSGQDGAEGRPGKTLSR